MCVIILKRVGEGRLKWVSIVTQLVHTLPQPGQFKPIVIMVIMIIGFFKQWKNIGVKNQLLSFCVPRSCWFKAISRQDRWENGDFVEKRGRLEVWGGLAPEIGSLNPLSQAHNGAADQPRQKSNLASLYIILTCLELASCVADNLLR